jgi:hypothetical protein
VIDRVFNLVNRSAFFVGWLVGRTVYTLEGLFEWVSDGYARGRDGLPVKVEPPKPSKPRKPLIDLAALSRAVKRASEGPESHADGRTPVAGTTTSADPR